MIVDMHCHFVPPDWFEMVKARPELEVVERSRQGGAIELGVHGVRYPLNETFFDASLQRARMERLGIDRTIVSLATPLIDYGADVGFAIQSAQACNDGFATLVSADPARFGAWAFLPMQAPEAAAAELKRCVKEHGFVGGHIATNVLGRYLPDERFAPVCEMAQVLDVPLFVHPANPAGRDRTQEFELTVIAGYMFDTTINIFRMICSGFLDRWPRLKLVCAHTGGYALLLRGRMQKEIDTNPALARVVKQPVGRYLERLYYDTAGFEEGYLSFAASVVPPSQLLFGTDAPFDLVLDDPLGFVRRGVPGPAGEAVLGANMLNLIGG